MTVTAPFMEEKNVFCLSVNLARCELEVNHVSASEAHRKLKQSLK